MVIPKRGAASRWLDYEYDVVVSCTAEGRHEVKEIKPVSLKSPKIGR